MRAKQGFAQLGLAICVGSGLLLAAGCQNGRSDLKSQQTFAAPLEGRALLSDALTRARADHKRVLLLFGADWCPHCKSLHRLIESDPAVRELVEDSYVVVPVDVGRSGRVRNATLIDRYQAPVFTDGIPALVILDSSGKRVAPSRENPWSVNDSTNIERLIGFLQQGAQKMSVPPRPAQENSAQHRFSSVE